jgi:hypothetical protein
MNCSRHSDCCHLRVVIDSSKRHQDKPVENPSELFFDSKDELES